MRILGGALLAVSLVALSACAKPWKNTDYPAWNFGISFRETPTVINTPANPKAGSPASIQVRAIQGNRKLMIEVDDTTVSGKSDEDLLRQIPHDAISDAGGTVAAHGDVKSGKVTGKDVTIDTGNGPTKRIRVFVVNHKAYQLITESTQGADDKEVQQFLDSFHFLS
jgi:hypothetical protein